MTVNTCRSGYWLVGQDLIILICNVIGHVMPNTTDHLYFYVELLKELSASTLYS